MKIYILEYNTILDCGHNSVEGVTTDEALAKQWESKGPNYIAIEWADGEIIDQTR